ncbi:MAG: hypothetical protein R3A10_22720 [Caldilineaceae bacterium]
MNTDRCPLVVLCHLASQEIEHDLPGCLRKIGAAPSTWAARTYNAIHEHIDHGTLNAVELANRHTLQGLRRRWALVAVVFVPHWRRGCCARNGRQSTPNAG